MDVVSRAAWSVAAALLPGIAAWWTGRSLVRRPDDPALPELLLARQQRVSALTVFSVIACTMLWAWALPLMLVALLAGLHPLRRLLFEETWTLPRYMTAQLRAFAGWMGPYVLLGVMPLLVLGAEPYHVPVALGLGASLLAWLHFYGEGWRWGSNASPLLRDDLHPRFEAVIARANAPMPALHRFGYDGSAMMNAVALPSLRGSGVAFSDRLLERLAPDEIVAIFAHEVAHLEHFDARRLRRMRLASWALVVLGIVVPLLAMAQSPTLRALLAWVWPVVVIFAMAQRSARAQAHETESDRRAVELTRDPEALIRGLTALHVAARMPRRWARDFERTASHPSLARRVQAIRATGETLGIGPADVAIPGAIPAAGVAAATPDAGAMEPAVFQSTTAGRWVILDASRAHWCDGVAEGTAPEPAMLREQASSYRAQRYGDLAELRVAADGDVRVLRATDRDGRSWSVPLQLQDVARAQAALDRVDVSLGTQRADPVREEVAGRLLVGAIAFASLMAAQFGLVLLAAVVALVRPLPAILALAGGMSIGRALVALGEADTTWMSGEQVAALAVMLVLGAGSVWLAMRRRQERVTKAGMVSLIALVGMAAGPLLAAMATGAADWRAGEPGASSIAVALLGASVALLVMRGRARRTAGVLCAVLALPIALLGVGSDRLQGRAASIEWTPARAVQLSRAELPAGSSALQLSPSGDRWAVQHFSADGYARYARRSAWSFIVGDFAGARRTLEAGEVQLVDDDRLLALTPLPMATELRLEAVASGAVLRADTLPPMEQPKLWLDRAAGRWSVTGGDPEGQALVRVDGAIGAAGNRVARLATDGAHLVSVVHRDAVSIAVPRRASPLLSGPAVMLAGSLPFRSDLWRVDSTGRRVAGHVGGWPRCAQSGIAEDAVCIGTDARRSTLWHIGSSGATRIGALPLFYDEGGYADGRWVGASPIGGELLVVDPASRRGLRVSLPDSGYVTSVQPLRDAAAVLRMHGSSTAVVVYRIEEPARATLAKP